MRLFFFVWSLKIFDCLAELKWVGRQIKNYYVSI